jgi:hypothetical protein
MNSSYEFKSPMVYLDWNVFNKLEKIESLNPAERELYQFLE